LKSTLRWSRYERDRPKNGTLEGLRAAISSEILAEFAQRWRTPDPPAAALSVPTGRIEDWLADENSPFTIAIGCAEGNRTPDGGKTIYYYGHLDPGNSKRNQGSFSYQHAANSPEEADRLQIAKLRSQIDLWRDSARKAGKNPDSPLLACSFFDLFTQSEAAATFKGGYLDQIKSVVNPASTDELAYYRAKSFFNPDTGKLEAWVGWSDLLRDQNRRMDCLLEALRAQGLVN